MCDECGENVKREPITIYAIVDQILKPQYVRHAFVIAKFEGRFTLRDDQDFEETYEDCEYGGFSGFVVYEGIRYATPANPVTDDEQTESPDYWPHDPDWEFCLAGEWRRGTAADAEACGLISLDNTVASSSSPEEPKA